MGMLFSAPKMPAVPPAPPAAPVAPVVPTRVVDPYRPITEEDAASGETIMPEEPIQAATVAEEERRRRARRRGRRSTVLTGGGGLTTEASVYRPGLSLLAGN